MGAEEGESKCVDSVGFFADGEGGAEDGADGSGQLRRSRRSSVCDCMHMFKECEDWERRAWIGETGWESARGVRAEGVGAMVGKRESKGF